jgi:folate-dependent phosphoribosylglycinamide formyltransferase PurN
VIGRLRPLFLKVKIMVKFKQSGVSLNIKGFGQINDGNITEELAKRILELHPNLAEVFVFEEVKEEKKGK